MRILFRYLLWILIVALPLQGGAVAFMVCDAGVASSMPTAHHTGAAQSAIAHAGHDRHCAQAGDAGAGGTHLKCGHCASCVVGPAAPPARPLVLTPATFSTFAVATVDVAIIDHIPATLERPPRASA